MTMASAETPDFHDPAWREEARLLACVVRLGALQDELQVVQGRLTLMVQRCREAGATWQQIGAVLDISTQAAQQRYATSKHNHT